MRFAAERQVLTRKLFRIPYLFAQRVIPMEAVRVLVLDVDTQDTTRSMDTHSIRFLSPGLAAEYAASGQLLYSEAYLERIDEDRMWCVGAESAEGLQSFAWLHEGIAEKEMNEGYHSATATEIRLSADAAFVFNVFTTPESRGLGLMPAILGHAATKLRRTRGVRWLVTTTEITNDAARAGFLKSGFREVGQYFRYGIGKQAWGSYPKPEGPIRGFA